MSDISRKKIPAIHGNAGAAMLLSSLEIIYEYPGYKKWIEKVRI